MKKGVHWLKIDRRFDDTMEGLLAAANKYTRFVDVMTKEKKKIVKNATEDEKDRLRNIINQHCDVEEGESCDCAWCNESNANSNKRRKL